MKMAEKLIAIELRKKGESYNQIRKKLKISKSSLSLWLRNIPLTKKQQHYLYHTLKQQNAYKLAKNKQKTKQDHIKKITNQSVKEANKQYLNSFFVAGLMLYWAEGDKSKITEAVKFSNSDTEMIKLMMKWFRQICLVPENKFHIALHIHSLHCRKNIEKYWSKITNLPLKQFHKTQIKVTTLKHRKNPLYNGTCSIRIGNKDLFRTIMGWKLGVLEKI